MATSDTSPENPAGLRAHAYAETYKLTPVDRFGVWLSLRQILRWANDPSGKVIGDFGAGYHARLVRALLDRVKLAYVADVSLAPEVMADSRVKALQGPLPGTLEAIPTGSLDLVFCISVLEHVDDVTEFLYHLGCLVAPGGLLFLTVDCREDNAVS